MYTLKRDLLLIVAVTGTCRNQTIFLSIFDRYFDVHVFVTISQNAQRWLIVTPIIICAARTPTLGLYVQSIALGL